MHWAIPSRYGLAVSSAVALFLGYKVLMDIRPPSDSAIFSGGLSRSANGGRLESKVTINRIKNKVAMISDTQFTNLTIPHILHFSAVLGEEWPIVFFTAKTTYDEEWSLNSKSWQRAVNDGRVEIRFLPEDIVELLKERHGVNIFLTRPWLWEQLAPAQHVLMFQADAMICSASERSLDDFLHWDFIGAPVPPSTPYMLNGGLSLRNRTMILDILNEGGNWEEESKSGNWSISGEDAWFSNRMVERGGHVPGEEDATKFACSFPFNIEKQKRPLGYHKVHMCAPQFMEDITTWCPEIFLATAKTLAGQQKGQC